ADDGGNCGTAFPRVCGDPECGDRSVAGCFFDDDSDDVREVSATSRQGRETQHLLPDQRVEFRSIARDLQLRVEVGFEISAADVSDNDRSRNSEWLALLQGAEGVFPAAGYGADHGHSHWSAGRIFSVDGGEDAALYPDRDGGSGSGYYGRLHRRKY